jgi:hypothetical protein
MRDWLDAGGSIGSVSGAPDRHVTVAFATDASALPEA